MSSPDQAETDHDQDEWPGPTSLIENQLQQRHPTFTDDEQRTDSGHNPAGNEWPPDPFIREECA
ncbi:hypothetical protein [Chloroflexus sp.]|uniref:hypothetical protein n=1 Tax=Chloroflexus sp. TaxID=1904827 RepID=UPI00404AE2E5